MTVAQRESGLEVTGVRIKDGAGGGDWYASVRVTMTGPQDKVASGWVHVSKKGYKLSIEDWDDFGEGGSIHVDALVAAERDHILDAVREKMEAVAQAPAEEKKDAAPAPARARSRGAKS